VRKLSLLIRYAVISRATLFSPTYFEKCCQDDVNNLTKLKLLDDTFHWEYTYNDTVEWLKNYMSERFGSDYTNEVLEKLSVELDYDIYFRLNHMYN